MFTRPIDTIVVHCSASPNGNSLFVGKLGDANFKTPVQVIDGWHATRGFKREARFLKAQNPELKSVGYHFVIYTNGTVVTGRHLNEVGAHVQGHNANSIGICMVGTSQYTPAQWHALKTLVASLLKTYTKARVCGHRDCSPDKNHDGKITPNEWLKTCPGFDVRAWGKAGCVPPPEAILKDAA